MKDSEHHHHGHNGFSKFLHKLGFGKSKGKSHKSNTSSIHERENTAAKGPASNVRPARPNVSTSSTSNEVRKSVPVGNPTVHTKTGSSSSPASKMRNTVNLQHIQAANQKTRNAEGERKVAQRRVQSDKAEANDAAMSSSAPTVDVSEGNSAAEPKITPDDSDTPRLNVDMNDKINVDEAAAKSDSKLNVDQINSTTESEKRVEKVNPNIANNPLKSPDAVAYSSETVSDEKQPTEHPVSANVPAKSEKAVCDENTKISLTNTEHYKFHSLRGDVEVVVGDLERDGRDTSLGDASVNEAAKETDVDSSRFISDEKAVTEDAMKTEHASNAPLTDERHFQFHSSEGDIEGIVGTMQRQRQSVSSYDTIVPSQFYKQKVVQNSPPSLLSTDNKIPESGSDHPSSQDNSSKASLVENSQTQSSTPRKPLPTTTSPKVNPEPHSESISDTRPSTPRKVPPSTVPKMNPKLQGGNSVTAPSTPSKVLPAMSPKVAPKFQGGRSSTAPSTPNKVLPAASAKAAPKLQEKAASFDIPNKSTIISTKSTVASPIKANENSPALKSKASFEFPKELDPDGTWNAPIPYPDANCPMAPTYRNLTSEQEEMYEEVLKYCLELKEIPVASNSSKKTDLIELERLWLTRECILRYLRATKWHVSNAKKRIVDTLVWRRHFGVNNMDPDEIQEENATGKQVLLGYDKDGRPCLYLYPARQNTKTSPLQIRHLVFSLECAIDLMPPGVETLALLINFKSSSNRSNPSVGQGKEVLNILQTHYCERLGRALVINIPWAVWGFFKLISPFIDPITREKLKFNEPLDRYVPKDQLDSNFGGSLHFEYHHEKYWPQLVELCKSRRLGILEKWRKMGSKIGTSEWDLKGGEEYVELMQQYVRPSLTNRSSSPTVTPTVNTDRQPKTLTNSADELSPQKRRVENPKPVVKDEGPVSIVEDEESTPVVTKKEDSIPVAQSTKADAGLDAENDLLPKSGSGVSETPAFSHARDVSTASFSDAVSFITADSIE
ncbi:meiotic sec14 cytosolic factor family, phospholipid-intermembrane transfer protein Pdr16 [Schizosaccharomyces pombe]|uniref:CRAL-TRIO domain-containing protein C23B6.04c n=1 Tax=Schizosaccharomyces pombe (strain 972 / ATCC 24843) TaxID=284812 RepID=YJX4_SCHPO|nr:putative sec14 family protein [Schizosaccharomyces pombe]Q9UU99.1 RecName: Full=CRAL-TRIO domain-containing protein C23B6.04c [Schizosaccharomyces pombe 972h-]CAB51563.1 sec14 cytosolic factor family (predicted) [Schizosaccharomyces pombe]|eukprot:NP_588127.1 putative sec14 family protein [Schizosaccharomyces pombe]